MGNWMTSWRSCSCNPTWPASCSASVSATATTSPSGCPAPHIQQPADSATFIRHAIEKFARGGADHGHRVSGEVVGVIGYNQIDHELGKVTIGYWLAERWQGTASSPGLPGPDPSRLRRRWGWRRWRSAPPRERGGAEPCASAAGNDPGGDYPAGGAAGGQGGGSCALRPAGWDEWLRLRDL